MVHLSLISPYFRSAAGRLLLGFLCLSVCDFGQMVVPRLVGEVFDRLADEGATGRILASPLAAIVGLALMVATLRYVWRHLIYGFSRRLEKDLRRRLQERFTALSLDWHQRNSSGDMMALATNDIEAVRMAVGFGLVSLIDALVLGLSAIGFMLSIDPRLSLWALMPMPLISVLTWRFGGLIFDRMTETQNIFGRLTEVVREQLAGLKVIRAMALEPLSRAEVDKVSRLYMDKNVSLSLLMGGFFPLMTLLTNLALALTLYFGGRSAILGSISPGEFVAFISYLTLLSWPMMAMGLTLGLVQEGLASLGRLGRVLSASEESVHPPDEAPSDDAPGAGEDGAVSGSVSDGGPVRALPRAPSGPFPVEFRGVRFAYPGGRAEVLSGLDLALEAGIVTALTGPTGCGKSTLAALIPALHEPSAGTILVAGRATTEWPLGALRVLFGYVPQEGHIFTGTLRANLAFGRPGASDGELIAASEAAELPVDPRVFPDGLDTLIGERGLTLSGGQRQRLALARALLLDPPFLILDDTFSAVDADVEDRIMDRLMASRRGRGALVVSHRATTLAKSDRVAVLEDGRLAELGGFQELAASGGYVSRLAALARLGADGWRPGGRGLAADRSRPGGGDGGRGFGGAGLEGGPDGPRRGGF